jgi:vitamin B12 transporter
MGAWRLAGGVLAQSHRYEDAMNKVRLGGYTTLNLRSEYSFDQHWSVQARLENALDKGYETAAFYPAMGRTFFLSIRYQ